MKTLVTMLAIFCTITVFSQSEPKIKNEKEVNHKYRVSLPMIIVPQLFEKGWDDRTHTQHIELHIKRELDNKNIIGVKLATWRLFQPMGILWWDGLTDKVKTGSEYYPGYVRETGVGVSYQRMLWKGLFATVEVLPQFKTYLDEDNKKIGNGFKLYNSFHLGYHLPFGKKKQFFVEPQVHSQFWVFDTNTPESFEAMDGKWKNYFLFEPNLYFGFKF
ncbi:MAG: hypothetical protein R2809_14230 [Flavobacteriales bacterium]